MKGAVRVPHEPHSPADDGQTLVRRIASGDPNALAVLYDLHAGLVYSLCTLILGNAADAEEAVADTFVQVWRTAGRFDAGRGPVRAWLVTIARSRALDLSRGRARRAAHVDASADPAAAIGVASATSRMLPDTEQVDAKRLTLWGLQQLPTPQREAIELAYLDGLTHSEIAERVDAPLGTIKTRIRDGMKRLRTMLESAQEGVGS